MLPNKPFTNKPSPLQPLQNNSEQIHIKHQLQTKLSMTKYQLTHYYNSFKQLQTNQLDYCYIIIQVTLNHQKIILT